MYLRLKGDKLWGVKYLHYIWISSNFIKMQINVKFKMQNDYLGGGWEAMCAHRLGFETGSPQVQVHVDTRNPRMGGGASASGQELLCSSWALNLWHEKMSCSKKPSSLSIFYGLKAMSDKLPFLNKVSLEHNYTHLHMCCPWVFFDDNYNRNLGWHFLKKPTC